MKPAPDFSPLLKSFIAAHSFKVVTEQDVGDVLAANSHTALFFSGDWERLAESNDIAVVLPELHHLAEGLTVAVVARSAERSLQLRYRFNKFPALVFMRGTGYLGAILGMRGWSEYGSEIAGIMARQVSEPPPYQFPEGCIPGASADSNAMLAH